MIGKQILSYKIESLLGEGGMGNVYLASHVTLDRKVAVKSILPQLVKNEEIKSRFLNEAKTMSKLQHPNIVALYDYYTGEEGLFLFMEYVEGKELHDYLIDLGKPLDEDLSVAFMKQILSAFSHAHKKGIVHRDIKPSNILIGNDGEIKILDFGIAKILGEGGHNLTKTGTQVGTVYYMSPEQVEGKPVSHLSDIYSIGVTMYQLLTMVNPYKNCTTEFEIYKKITGDKLPDVTELNPALSDSMVKIIHKATAKDPKDRFQSCQEFSDAFDANFGTEEIPVSKTSNTQKKTPEPVAVQNSKNKKPLLIAGVALILVIMGGIFFFRQDEASDNDKDNDDIDSETSITETDEDNYESQAVEEGIDVVEDQFSVDDVYPIILAYYSDLNNENFNAWDYYASYVDNFITRKNISPNDINTLNQEKTDFLYSNANITNNKLETIHESGNTIIATFWVDFSCWRTRKEKWQHCDINVEVIFNEKGKIISYREISFTNLVFTDGRYAVSNNSEITNSYVNNYGSFVFQDECYMIFTGAKVNESDCITWVDNKKREGYSNPGYLWIPDYPSLSGKKNYATFMGPYSSNEECKTELKSFPSNQRFYYCKKVSMNDGSNNPEMDEIRIN